MIRLTKSGGLPVIVPADILIDFKPPLSFPGMVEQDPATFIYWGDREIMVQESPEEVARKVLEYRLEMINYRAGDDEQMHWTRKILGNLAGLEE